MAEAWHLDQTNGELTLHTGVTGRAARMGHRLSIALTSWRITVHWRGKTPSSAQLEIDLDSLQVLSGEGGLTPLTGPEKSVVRANALKTLHAKRFPVVTFAAETITASDDGYLLTGPLTLNDTTVETTVELTTTQDSSGWQLACSAEVSHQAFGLKPYSMAMGAMKVADVVRLEFAASHAGK